MPADPKCFNFAGIMPNPPIMRHTGQARKVLQVGCWGASETLNLLWGYEADEIVGIEIDPGHIARAEQETASLRGRPDYCLGDQIVRYIQGDISKYNNELVSDYFDLAYCEHVLYYFSHEKPLDEAAVRAAIQQMARVVKPGGTVIAIEPKLGAEFRTEGEGFTQMQVRISDPIDISFYFEAEGLIDTRAEGDKYWQYVYRKP